MLLLLALEGTESAETVERVEEVEALEVRPAWLDFVVGKGDEAGDEVEVRKRNMMQVELRARVMRLRLCLVQQDYPNTTTRDQLSL